MNEMNIYACGGCGTNILKTFLENQRKLPALFKHAARINPFVIDTSMSDMKDGIKLDDDKVFLIPGMDGKGKKRSGEDLQKIAATMPQILNEFRPAKFNIIIHSTGGGSGSTIGPILNTNLMKDPETVNIIFAIGSSGCQAEVINTIDTISGYDKNAKLKNIPAVMRYLENTSAMTLDDVNNVIIEEIILLAHMFSGVSTLDTSDIKNWAHYNKMTEFEAGLSGMEIIKGPISLDRSVTPMSAITLRSRTAPDNQDDNIAYRGDGLYPETIIKEMGEESFPMNFVIIDNYFTSIVNEFQKKNSEMKAATDLAKKKHKAIEAKENAVIDEDLGIIV